MGRFRRVRILLHAFTTLVVVKFILSMHSGSIAFVNSSFLGQFFSPEGISILYAIDAAIIVCALMIIPTLLLFIKARTLFIFLIPLMQLSVLFFGLAKSPTAAVFFFILHGVSMYLVFYLFDLYLEGVTQDESKTGNIRGTILTVGNLAIFLAPLLVTVLVINDYYPPIYAFSALVLVPAFALALTQLKKLSPAPPQAKSLIKAVYELWCCKPGMGYIIAAQFLLRLFYAWILVYVPLYLFETGDFSWQVIGFVIAFALLPFLFLEIPLGILADRYFGEKEILTIGFVIMIIATALLSFIPVSLIVFWALALFFGRVGSAMVEVAAETHFFKRVSDRDPGLISLFRIMSPLSYLIAPLIALIFLPWTGLQYLFVSIAAVLLISIPISLKIVDTK